MTAGEARTSPPAAAAFTDIMARLASGVAVVTARRHDGEPCGLLVSSLCSYSVDPPSILVAIDSATRSYPVLCEAGEFGVHLLTAAQADVAEVFAGRAPRKFDAVAWHWDGSVPRLEDAADYLRCRTSVILPYRDHAVVIGAMDHGVSSPDVTEPLVYYRRRLGWRLIPVVQQHRESGRSRRGWPVASA